MPSIFSVPAYPAAVGYTIQYVDPISGNPNQPTSLGTWNTLVTNVPSPSNFFDAAGDDRLRMYRCSPIIVSPADGVTHVTLRPYNAFTAEQYAPGAYKQNLFDAQITNLLPQFREFVGDYGNIDTASTNINFDSGAGVGLLTPDGVTTTFAVADVDTNQPRILEYSVSVVKNNLTLLMDTDYSVDWNAGTVTFATAPLTSDAINIDYTQVKYTNAMLNHAMQESIDFLATLGINGYATNLDNNVLTVTGTISSTLRPIIFTIAQKVLNRAMIRSISEQARSYKSADFSIDTAPGRLIDGMSAQSNFDWSELNQMANQYIKSATVPMVRDAYMSFFDFSGVLPIYNIFVGSFYGAGYSFFM